MDNLNNKILDTMFKEAAHEVMSSICDAVPDEEDIDVDFSAEFLNNMGLLIKTNQKKGKFNYGMMNKAAAVILILIASAAVITFSVEAVRVHFLNVNVETHEKYSKFSVNDTVVDDLLFSDLVPANYTLSDVLISSDSVFETYANGDLYIKFCRDPLNSDIMVDSENAVSETIVVNDITFYAFLKDNKSVIVWIDNTYNNTLISNLEYSAIVEILENIY